MTISAIIPTKFRHQDLLNTLESLYLQTRLPDEIIIVDDNIATDVKDVVFSQFNGLDEFRKNKIILKYIHGHQTTGLTQARNKGIESNESDIVLFLDDDVVLERDFVLKMMEIYKRNPDVYGVSGVITNLEMGQIEYIMRKLFERGNFADDRVFIFTRLDKYKNTEYIPVSKLPGGLTSYKREIFKEFKFDETFIKTGVGEDFDFSFRVSRRYKIVITPQARLIHVESPVARADFKKIIGDNLYFKYYFFKKNLDKTIGNYMHFGWLIFGDFLGGLLLTIFRHDTSKLKGVFIFLRKIIKREECDFIKIAHS